MPMSKGLGVSVAVGFLILLLAPAERADASPNLGVPATADDIAAYDISVLPSGEGLPKGTGTPAQGKDVYAARCVACHGVAGVGKPADALVGGQGTLATAKPLKTIGSYWPYATTLFDFVRRAMPYDAPKSLTNEQVYAVTAYLLNLNGIIPENAVLDSRSLPKVVMPNHDGFINAWPGDRH